MNPIKSTNFQTVTSLIKWPLIFRVRSFQIFILNSSLWMKECTSLRIPSNDMEYLSTISNIFKSQQPFSKRVVYFFVSSWITNYCIFLTMVLNFYLRFSVSEKQTWRIEIKDNLLQCLLSCAERSSVIVIYSSCQEKSITDDIKMTYFAWATYCLNVHNLIERDYF